MTDQVFHFGEAERLIAAANDALDNPGKRTLEEATTDARLFFAEAQIHAILALATVTAKIAMIVDEGRDPWAG